MKAGLTPGIRPLDSQQAVHRILGPGIYALPFIALLAARSPAGLAVSVLLAARCGLTASAIFADRLARPALILAGLLGLLFWTAEGFGGIATGQATGPNTGPLLILLAVCFWPPGRSAGLLPGCARSI
jgi:hypothetical protein